MTDRLSFEAAKVGTPDGFSSLDVTHGDWTVGDEVVLHIAHKILCTRPSNSLLDGSGKLSLVDVIS
jgi:hypothetical protein